MTTTTVSMTGEEAPEQKAERIKAARAASLEKARAIRAAKLSNDVTPQKTSGIQTEVWREAFFVAMRTFDVKNPAELNRCSAMADAVISEMKKQGKL